MINVTYDNAIVVLLLQGKSNANIHITGKRCTIAQALMAGRDSYARVLARRVNKGQSDEAFTRIIAQNFANYDQACDHCGIEQHSTFIQEDINDS